MKKKLAYRKWLGLIVAFIGVFLLFSSDLYGFDDEVTFKIRFVGMLLALIGIFVNWIQFIIDFLNRRRAKKLGEGR
jgi:drug/metabolite transporter (DMT)-like permease